MFVLGHIGVGRELTTRWRATLPAIPFVLGTLLPDIIDKPLYYARLWPYISSTRTLGHTGVLLLLLAGSAYGLRSRALAAVALGVATHLLLDCAVDLTLKGPGSAWVALTWPLSGGGFAISPKVLTAHLRGLWQWPIVIGEALGLALLAWQVRRRRAGARPSRP